MHSGDEFNPRNRFVGLWLPDSLARYRGLSHGAKLLYSRLCWHLDDRTGECSPDEEEVADSLGVSSRQLRTYLKELESHQLIRTRRRGLGLTNQYVFLWHPVFEDNPIRRGSRSEESFLSDRKDIALPDRKKASSQDRKKTSDPTLLHRIKDLEGEGRIKGKQNLGTVEHTVCPWCHGAKRIGEGVNRSACGGCGGRGYV